MTSFRTSSLRLLIILAAALLLAIPMTAAAQAVDQAQTISVALWPEYDRSEVLVIYRVTLLAGAPQPATVNLLVPPDAPALTAAAYRSASGELVNASYTRTEGSQADTVTVEAPGTEIQIEFYLPLQITGDARQFSFTWPGGFGTQKFEYEIQQPVGATAMEVAPTATSTTTDALGLTYHLVDLGSQTAADQPKVSFTYNKTTSQLSVDALGGATALATPTPASRPPLDVRSFLPWLLLIAGLALIAGGVIYFLRTRSDDRPIRPRHRPSRAAAESDDRVDASPVFCHNCGTQATATDRFCRQCGAALRS
jgi:hypothetical protein